MVCVGFKGHSGGANVGITATRKQTKHRTDVGITATQSKKHAQNRRSPRWTTATNGSQSVGRSHTTKNGGQTSPNALPPGIERVLPRICFHVLAALALPAIAFATAPKLGVHVVDDNVPAPMPQDEGKELSTSNGVVLPRAADVDDIQERNVIWGLKALCPHFLPEHGLRELQPRKELVVIGDTGHEQCVQARAMGTRVLENGAIHDNGMWYVETFDDIIGEDLNVLLRRPLQAKMSVATGVDPDLGERIRLSCLLPQRGECCCAG